MKTHTDRYIPGDRLMTCSVCGFDYRLSQMRKIPIPAKTLGSTSGVSRNAYEEINPISSMFSQSGLTSFDGDALLDDVLTYGAGFHTDTAAANSYLAIDLTDAFPRAYARAKFYVNGDVVAIWNIQYSSDNSTWTTAYTGLDCSGGAGWKTATWTQSAPYRYWRFLKTNDADTGYWHTELKMYKVGVSTVNSRLPDGPYACPKCYEPPHERETTPPLRPTEPLRFPR